MRPYFHAQISHFLEIILIRGILVVDFEINIDSAYLFKSQTLACSLFIWLFLLNG